MALDAGEDLWAELGVAKLQRRQVDGEHQIRRRHLPAGQLGTALFQHVAAEQADEPQLLRQRDELVRRDHAELGVGPAAEQLGPVQLAGAGADDGLVDCSQLAGFDGQRQLGSDQLAALELGIEFGIEQGAVLLLALALGQRGFGVAQQAFGVVALPWAMPRNTGIWILCSSTW